MSELEIARDASPIARRRFLALAASGLSAAFLAACGADEGEADSAPKVTSSATTAPSGAAAVTATAAGTAQASSVDQGQVLVGDVMAHALRSDRWPGEFGFVTFKMHEARVGGQAAYYIRTDASDAEFARTERLVLVPKLGGALQRNAGFGNLYVFLGAAASQPAVLSTAPHMPDYTPIFRLNRVTFRGAPKALESAEAVMAAAAANEVTIEATSVMVNYPVVKWPGGELPSDSKREAYLGDGQLIDPPDVARGQVTFKLHSCYPNSRYIVTDVTMPPMAKGMNIAPSPGAVALTEAGATAEILVFGNGVKGSGPMGFQKSVTDTVAGDPAWSPMWDHFTFVWPEGASAAVLKTNAEVVERERTANLRRFPGTPDTNGELFVVNCPVPVVAPVA